MVQKSAGELKILQQPTDKLFFINELTAGTCYNFLNAFNTNFRAGIQASAFFAPQKLHALYGKVPLSLEIYIRLLPINMNALEGMKHATNNHLNH